jgi:hypothetical protein
MEEEIKNKILTLLDQHRVMTLATLRPMMAGHKRQLWAMQTKV